MLVQNMADRIAANASALRADIGNGTSLAAYTTALNQSDVGGTVRTCAGSGAALDLCEWGNQIAGAAEKAADSRNVGTLTDGRGCVRQPDGHRPVSLPGGRVVAGTDRIEGAVGADRLRVRRNLHRRIQAAAW